jgi:hypothetical protein
MDIGGLPAIKRFYAKFEMGDDNECWIWKGAKSLQGYGLFWTGKKLVGAHRYMYRIQHNNLGDLHVLHQCDNKLCVNPLHLRAGTEAENQQDKVAKGRQARGEKIHTAKLTEAKVRTILRKHKNGQSALSLSKEYGVCYGNMLNIVHRVTWKHVS